MHLVHLVEASPLWISMLLLFFAAWIEYVFPPFPGDTLLVAGGFFVAQGALPLPLTFLVLTLGSVSGCAAAWGLGYHGLGLRRFIKPEYLERIQTSYARWGTWFIIGNRFVPGLRGAFMLSTGLIKMPFKPILIWGTVSAILWNSTLIGLGYVFSDSLENLLQITQAYGKTVLILIGLGLIGWFFFRMGRLRSCNRSKDQNPSSEPEKSPEQKNP
ncbi:MAG: DedA family protein [Myxococcaceae bacterium]